MQKLLICGLVVIAVGLAAVAEEAAEPALLPPIAAEPAADVAGEPTPDEFLAMARKPFLEDVWCQISGDIRYRGKDGKKKVPISLAMRLKPFAFRAEITLPEKQVYSIRQTYGPGEAGVPKVELSVQEGKSEIKLETLGMQPDDVTFCFLYWNLVKELAREEVRGQVCRVLVLAHPEKAEQVHAWMAKDYGFPLKLAWFKADEREPYRTFEFTDFKKKDKFWFPKAARITGPGWKSLISFDDAQVAKPQEKAEPADLFKNP